MSEERASEAPAAAPAEVETTEPGDEAARAGLALEELVPADPPPEVDWSGVRSARALSRKGRTAKVMVRGDAGPLDVRLAPEVDGEIVDEAIQNRDLVLVEVEPDGQVLLVGALRARIPDVLRLRARQIEIEGEREVLLRSGRAAARLRADGDVEIVGSRISASSRGLFRLVGRILRLN